MSLFYGFVGRGNFCAVYPANQCAFNCISGDLRGANRFTWFAMLPGKNVILSAFIVILSAFIVILSVSEGSQVQIGSPDLLSCQVIEYYQGYYTQEE
jgi:hypothetical protein